MSLVFDVAKFKARFPEYKDISVDMLNDFYLEASMMFERMIKMLSSKTNKLQILLNLVVAHLCFVYGAQPSGNSPISAGGIIAHASEGTVRISFQNSVKNSSELVEWLKTSQYGRQFLSMTISLRRFYPNV